MTVATPSIDDDLTILQEKVEAAVKSLRNRKSTGADNITAEMIKAGGEHIIDALTTICNKIWSTKHWLKLWTQLLVITIPKKEDHQICQNYRTIHFVSHMSKVMFKVLLN